MAIPYGKPATDFSAMNREWVRAVAEEAVAEGGIPAPENPSNGNVLTYDSSNSAWVAAAPTGIPAPANPSNGNVLTYDSSNSAWVAAAPSGGGNDIFYIIIASIDAEHDTFTLSTSDADMAAAFEAGKHCFLKYGSAFYPVTGYEADTDYLAFSASAVYVFSGTISYVSFSYENDDGTVAADYAAGEKSW